jgi:hypothetical protein
LLHFCLRTSDINVISKVIREEKRDTVREFMHNIRPLHILTI